VLAKGKQLPRPAGYGYHPESFSKRQIAIEWFAASPPITQLLATSYQLPRLSGYVTTMFAEYKQQKHHRA
jgi:hypothetical protein